MQRWLKCLILAAGFLLAFPSRSPAPIVYRPGEGWVWEPVGGETWMRTKAQPQLEVAQAAFDQKDFTLAARAAARVVRVWPLSDYAAPAQYLIARSHQELHQDEKAFNDFQTLLDKYPKAANYEEVMQRQFEIANRYLDGQRFKIWGWIPGLPSMDKTVKMYEKVIKNGPYSDVAAQAQLNIGAAHEKQSRFLNTDNEPYILAAKAYERAADRYHDRPKVAAEALFRQGKAYEKQAQAAEYDQGTAGHAIDAFSDFKAEYPDDPRVKQGDQIVAALKDEQARGNFEIARYYESLHQWKSARIYYNEVVSRNPDSPLRDKALQQLAILSTRLAESPAK